MANGSLNDGRVALGHRRLAIIDLTEGGAQPMQSADGQLVITFNGEIYNYRELRRELEASGHVFRSESDTEVLLHLYQAKGIGHAARPARHVRLCPVGCGANKPCCWRATRLASNRCTTRPPAPPTSTRNGTLRFASQVKALLAGGHDRHRARARRPHRLLPVGQRARALHAVPRHPRPAGRALPCGWAGRAPQNPSPFASITDILAHAANNPAARHPG
jgi:asparagine synthetase B (glutamine-hydrolysing)